MSDIIVECAAHDANPVAPQFEVPKGAWDVHAHVCGREDLYPRIAERLYNPPLASVQDYIGMLDALHIDRGVLVQPSVYGEDNSAMVDALKAYPARLRGVAVLSANTNHAELERLHAVGVRGVRFNIVDLKNNKGQLALKQIKQLAEKIKNMNWHIEFLMHANEFPDMYEQLGDLPVQLVFGHLGYVPTIAGLDTPGFNALLRLAKDQKAWIKLTAPYRLTLRELPYADVDAFAEKLVDQVSDRLIWGSDWPHVYIKTKMPNDGDLFNLFARWAGGSDMIHKILVDNPTKLYGY